jgi:molecular chaperone DnaJ
MNRIEALKILGLKPSATENEVKKRFRELSKKKHPDKNKEPGAEEEYKKISAAFTYLKDPPPEPVQFPEWPGADFGDFKQVRDFFNRHSRGIYKPEPINVSVSLSFKDSVLGCIKKLIFDRTGLCSKCGGLGHEPCTACQGAGFAETVSRHGNMTFTNRTICTICSGARHNGVECDKCSKQKVKKAHIEVDVSVPGGVHDGQIIRLQGAGNVIADESGISHGDVLLRITVESDRDMIIVDRDVISTIKISLCEALKGVKKKIRTVKGDTTIMIREGVKHKDQVKLSGYGVEGKGNHIFMIEVGYPKETDKLIEFLENNKEE